MFEGLPFVVGTILDDAPTAVHACFGVAVGGEACDGAGGVAKFADLAAVFVPAGRVGVVGCPQVPRRQEFGRGLAVAAVGECGPDCCPADEFGAHVVGGA